MTGAGVHDLAAPYALGALAEHERRRFEEHLPHCVRCRLELPALQDAAAALAYAVQPAEPPPRLRRAILTATRSPHSTRAVKPRPRPPALPLAAAFAAAAACAAIGVGIWATRLSSDLDRARAASRAEVRAVRIVADPHAARYPLRGARGQVVVASTREAALVVERLRRAPRGSTYELWVVVARAPRPAGVFESGGEQTVVALTRRVPPGARVAVSLEHGRGGPRLKGTLLFGAKAA